MNLKEFSDSLKKVFGSLLPLKTADSNYAVGLFNKADGTPAGMMDMSALASVLGGEIREISSNNWEVLKITRTTYNFPSLSFCAKKPDGTIHRCGYLTANMVGKLSWYTPNGTEIVLSEGDPTT